MKTKYIVFDGMDGSGKGIQIALLKQILTSHVVFTREPGGTPLAEDIRRILLYNATSLGEKSTPLNDFLLFWAAREELQQNLVMPALLSGKHVFSDRGDSSTFAYQICGEERKELFDLFMFVRQRVFAENSGRRQPDLYIVFDLPAEVARERVLQDTGRTKNRLDVRPIEYYRRVREGFLSFAKYCPVRFVDATRTPEETHCSVIEILEEEMITLELVSIV